MNGGSNRDQKRLRYVFGFSSMIVAWSLVLLYAHLAAGAVALGGIEDYMQRAGVYLEHLRQIGLLTLAAVLAGLGMGLTVPLPDRFSTGVTFPWWVRSPLLAMFLGWAAAVAYFVIGHTPRVFDSFNYLFQARNFALGQLYASIPPARELFQFPFIMMYNGHWFGSVYPGHSFFLALGILVGLPWLVNPVMATLTLWRTYSLGRLLFSPATAVIALLLGVLSPFFLYQSAIFMSHPTAAFLVLSGVYHYALIVKGQGRRTAAWSCGMFWGLALVTRPQAVFCIGLPFALHGLVMIRGRHFGCRRALIIASTAGVFQLGLFIYNARVTGNPMDNPRYRVSPYRRLGFGPDIGYPLADGSYSGHTPGKGIANTRLNLELLNAELYGWGGAFIFGLPVLLVTASVLDRRRTSWDLLMFGSILATVILYIAYFTPSPNFGPRYYLEVVPFMLLLTARGLATITRGLTILFGHICTQPARRASAGVLASMVLLFFVSFCVVRPRHSIHYGILPPIARAGNIPGLAELDQAIVMVSPQLFLANVFTWNSPNLDTPVIYIPETSREKLGELLAAFPGRVVYRLDWNFQSRSGRLVLLQPGQGDPP
ncbi:glycosyltransferase family 39 protein [bacterium]|nr:glycosyltransferase family 39 protein [candidate division CSSED10-310 bacterium]